MSPTAPILLVLGLVLCVVAVKGSQKTAWAALTNTGQPKASKASTAPPKSAANPLGTATGPVSVS